MMEVLYQDIIRARATGDWKLINEASLGRILQHVKAGGKSSFGMISGFRYGKSRKENLAANKKLEADLRGLGLGLIKVIGHWLECQDQSVPYKECPPDKLVDVTEIAFAVPRIKQADIKRLMNKYDQDGVVYLGPETKGKVIAITTDGPFPLGSGGMTPNRIAQGWSKIRGKTKAHWTFEGFDYRAQSAAETLIERVVESF